MRDGKWHFSQTLLKQAAPIRIIDVPTTCNHNIKTHGTNICNLFHCFYFLIRKFPTHKYFKFEHTSKLVAKFWPSVLLLWIFVNLLTIVASRIGITEMVAQLVTNYYSPNQKLPMVLTNIVARLPILYILTSCMYCAKNSR